MADVLNLLYNELVKLVSRWANRALVLLLVLGAVLSVALQWLSVKNGTGDAARQEGEAALQTQIETLRAEQPEDYEEQIGALQFLLTNNINVSENNWRLVAAQRIAEDTQHRNDLLKTGDAANQEMAERLTASIEQERAFVIARDYRGYYEKRLADVQGNAFLPQADRERQIWQYQYILDQQVAAEGSEWKYNLMLGMAAAMSELSSQQEQQKRGSGVNRSYEEQLKNTITIVRYRIENGVAVAAGDASAGFYYEEPSRYWQAMKTSLQAIAILTLAVIILAGSNVSGEFTSGTIKTLLCAPARRWKIITAKYAALLFSAFVLLLGLYLVNAIAAGCFFGFRDMAARYIYAVDGQARAVPGLLYMAWQYLLQFVPVLVYSAGAFCLSVLFRSTAIAVGINALFLFAGPYVVSWLKYTLGQDWARFLLFANLDLASIWNGQSLFPGQTVGFALVVIAVHMVLFLLIAWDSFLYRDLK